MDRLTELARKQDRMIKDDQSMAKNGCGLTDIYQTWVGFKRCRYFGALIFGRDLGQDGHGFQRAMVAREHQK